jgi:hypothetical protein
VKLPHIIIILEKNIYNCHVYIISLFHKLPILLVFFCLGHFDQINFSILYLVLYYI